MSAPLGKNNSQKNFKLIRPVKIDHVIFLDLTPVLRPNGMSIMIAFKGTKVITHNGPDATNYKKDRIIMANNGGTSLFSSKHNSGIPSIAYYKK